MSELEGFVERLASRGFLPSPELRDALRRVDPGPFVAEGYEALAYEDVPRPFDVGRSGPGLLPSARWAAVLLQALDPPEGADVLLVGSEGGYLASLLASLRPRSRVTLVEGKAR